jgi:hypothetical protein
MRDRRNVPDWDKLSTYDQDDLHQLAFVVGETELHYILTINLSNKSITTIAYLVLVADSNIIKTI